MNNNNNKTIMNPQTGGTISTQENAPVYVPKITLSGGGGQMMPGQAPAKTNVDMPAAKSSKLGLVYSIISFVFGILSLVAVIILGLFSIPLSVVGFVALVPYGVGIVISIVGIVLATLGSKEGDTSGLAKAGLIMNVIPLIVLAALVTLTVLAFFGIVAAFTSCMSTASQAVLMLL